MQNDALKYISASTIAHYDTHADGFRAGTMGHDVSQNIAALLRHIPAPGPYTILDFGCGPGRDLVSFSQLGHRAIGLDGSARFVEMARQHSGCEVWHQNFMSLSLPADYFDGIFANASLFHVPTKVLGEVLGHMHHSLRREGVLFSSNPRGNNEEGWNGQRYGVYHDVENWRLVMTEAGFQELEHYFRPEGLPRDLQSWLASVWRKIDLPNAPAP